ncbi:MAG: hypothetical protein ACRD6I_15765 [Candidatus Acidiferrales bacterium]
MVILSLKRQKIVNGSDHGGVSAPEPQRPAPRERFDYVRDGQALLGHYSGARYCAIVNESWQAEVAVRERCGNRTHVLSNLSDTSGVGNIAL